MKNIIRKIAKRTSGKNTPAKRLPEKAVSQTPSQKGLKKQYLKKIPACKVTFRLPKNAAPDAKTVTIVGDFNNWNVSESKMQRLKSGDFKITLELPCNREYRFRYLIDSDKWENDWFADRYIPNEYGDDDSVVVI